MGVLAMSGWSDLLADAGDARVPTVGNPTRVDVVHANRGPGLGSVWPGLGGARVSPRTPISRSRSALRQRNLRSR
eukprot:7856365-Lingulodinium_polyedra.AAC.1